VDREAFVTRYGGVFEHSPWVAEAAWEGAPYASTEALHAAMVDAVAGAPHERRLALIRAHPELADRAAIAGEHGAASAGEQAAAGLDRLTPSQHARLTLLTAGYRERFGFPFVICAREHTPDTIIDAVTERLRHSRAREEEIALAEIAKIAKLRLEDL
jgi:OHCU decarboxylase